MSATGLEIVAIGKSGEYDLVFDPATGTVTQAGVSIDAPGLADLLDLGADPRTTLDSRAALVDGLKRSAAADLCEMTVVAMRTGAVPDKEGLHYPVARIAELADIYAAHEDGGILGRDGVVDVFSALRLPGEASFAGGVFAVVRTGDPVTWELLRGKGHVVSRDGKYACFYWPYHAMGVETPLTIHAAVSGVGVVRGPAPTVLLAARAATALEPGTSFQVTGHHHEINGVAPVMVAPSSGIAPYYLLGGARLGRAVAAGELVRLDDLEGVALHCRRKGAGSNERRNHRAGRLRRRIRHFRDPQRPHGSAGAGRRVHRRASALSGKASTRSSRRSRWTRC